MKNTIIVSTDLDGTLLDHHNYKWDAALPAINRLRELNIPIIINTSKTFSEVEQLQRDLNFSAPFIVENGSAIYYPKDAYKHDDIVPYNADFDVQVMGETRSNILHALKHLDEEFQYDFEGFNDWSTAQVIEHTQLNEASAKLAQQREYSEPLIWKDSDARFDVFCRQIENKNMRVIRGGRFIHILGLANKGSAVQALTKVMYKNNASTLICLGDSYNDLDMLDIADNPVFVRSPSHDFPPHTFKNKNTIFTKEYGPTGWNDAIHKLLDDLISHSGVSHG